MTEQIERVGQLYKIDPRVSFSRTVRRAVLFFTTNPDLIGLKPAEVRVHPYHNDLRLGGDEAGLPQEVDHLPVVLDASVRVGHVFVCCLDE